jgi:hypothetical protein
MAGLGASPAVFRMTNAVEQPEQDLGVIRFVDELVGAGGGGFPALRIGGESGGGDAWQIGIDALRGSSR